MVCERSKYFPSTHPSPPFPVFLMTFSYFNAGREGGVLNCCSLFFLGQTIVCCKLVLKEFIYNVTDKVVGPTFSLSLAGVVLAINK